MARSSYIYHLIDDATGETIGLFTVKHEMITAWRSHPREAYCLRGSPLNVLRKLWEAERAINDHTSIRCHISVEEEQ